MWDGTVVANSPKSLRDKIGVSMLWRLYSVARGGKDWLGVLLRRTKSGGREWVKEGNVWKGPRLTSLERRTLHRPVSCDIMDVAAC